MTTEVGPAGAATVSVVVSVAVPSAVVAVTLMSVDPGATAVARPLAGSIVATPGVALDQAPEATGTDWLPLLAVTVNACVEPGAMLGFTGASVAVSTAVPPLRGFGVAIVKSAVFTSV